MNLKIDLHVHTTSSRDSFIVPEQLPIIARKKGIDGVAITNHDASAGYFSSEVIIIPGSEVTTCEGHILALGLSDPIEKGRSADDTISLIHDVGGIAVVPHPFDPVSPCVDPYKLKSRPDAIEVINSDALFFGLNTKYAMRAARQLGLPMVAGSDSHIPETVGDAYTLINSPSCDLKDLLNAIKSGTVQPEGRATSVSSKLLKLSRTLRSL